MTIAQLYQHLQTVPFRSLRVPAKLDLIMQNPIVRVASRAEAEEYAFCMIHVPVHILTQATHCWALELSYCGRITANHPAADYIATELRNGYRRTARKEKIRAALSELEQVFENYCHMPLSQTITHFFNELMERQRISMALPQEEPETATSVQRRYLHELAATEEANEEHRDSTRQAVAIQSDIQRIEADIATNGYAVTQVRPTRLLDRIRNLAHSTPQARMQETYREDQESIARALALSLNTPMEEKPRPKIKIPTKEIVVFCNANELFRYKVYDPLTKQWKTTFVSPSKAKKIQEILEAQATEDETACNVCMTAEGRLSCGVGSCAGRLCADCFGTWYLIHPECPCCRAPFIPVILRSESNVASSVSYTPDEEETSDDE